MFRTFYHIVLLSIYILAAPLPCRSQEARINSSKKSPASSYKNGFLTLRGGVNNIGHQREISFSGIFGSRYNSEFFLGLGINSDHFEGGSYSSAFVHGRIDMIDAWITPYINLDLGYTMSSVGTNRRGEPLLCGGAGLRLGISNASGIVVGADVRRHYSRVEGNINRIYAGLDLVFIKSATSIGKAVEYSAKRDDIPEGKRTRFNFRSGGSISNSAPGFDISLFPSFDIYRKLRFGVGMNWIQFVEDSFLEFFLTARNIIFPEKLSPLVFAEAGYSLHGAGGASTSESSGPMFGFGAGADYPVNSRLDVFLELGYKTQWGKRLRSERSTFSGAESAAENIFTLTGGVGF